LAVGLRTFLSVAGPLNVIGPMAGHVGFEAAGSRQEIDA